MTLTKTQKEERAIKLRYSINEDIRETMELDNSKYSDTFASAPPTTLITTN